MLESESVVPPDNETELDPSAESPSVALAVADVESPPHAAIEEPNVTHKESRSTRRFIG